MLCYAKSLQLCLTLCNPVDCSPPGSSIHGISEARILERVAISFSRGASQPRDGTHIFQVSCIGRQVLSHQPTWEAQSMCLVSQLCLLCDSYDPIDCSPPGSSVLGILQARILEWVTTSFSRGSSQPRERTQVSCIAGRLFPDRATREAQLLNKFWFCFNLVLVWNYTDIILEIVYAVSWKYDPWDQHSLSCQEQMKGMGWCGGSWDLHSSPRVGSATTDPLIDDSFEESEKWGGRIYFQSSSQSVSDGTPPTRAPIGTKLDAGLRSVFHWGKHLAGISFGTFFFFFLTIDNAAFTHFIIWWYLCFKPVYRDPFWWNIWERFIRHENPVFHSLHLLSKCHSRTRSTLKTHLAWIPREGNGTPLQYPCLENPMDGGDW